MTENEKRKEGDDLMTCFVIHKSTLLTQFLETAVLQKRLVVYHPLTNLSFAAVGFLLIIETLIISRRRMFVLTSFVLFCMVL